MFLSATNLDFMHADMVNDSMKERTYLECKSQSRIAKRFTMRKIVNLTSYDSNN